MSNPPMDPAFALVAKHPRPILRDPNIMRQAGLASRQGSRSWLSELELSIEDHFIPSPESKEEEAVRVYRSRDAESTLPVLLYLHGGGFFCGDLSSEESQCARYALDAHCAVVCVAYR